MAIIDTRQPGGGFGVLIETLLNKEKLEQQEQAQKLQEKQFRMQQEQMEFERGLQQERQQGLAALAPLLGPELQQQLQGLSPGAMAAAVPGAVELQRGLAETEQIGARTELLDEETQALIREGSLFDVTRRLQEAKTRLTEAEAARLEGAPTERERFQEEIRRANAEIGLARGRLANETRETMAVLQSQFGGGAAALASLPIGNLEEQLAEFDSPEEAFRNRLAVSSTVLGLQGENAAELQRLFDEMDGDPQAIINDIMAQDIDDQTKAKLFSAVQAAFPTSPLQPGEAPPGFWESFRSSWFGEMLRNAFIFDSPEEAEAFYRGR